MFRHTLFYSIKKTLFQKELLFWNLFFPLLLGTLFYLAFSQIMGSEQFQPVPVGVVNNEEYRNSALGEALEAASSPEDDNRLFDLKIGSQEEMDRQMSEGVIAGYVFMENGIQLAVSENEYQQSIIKIFLDTFLQRQNLVSGLSNDQSHPLIEDKIAANEAKAPKNFVVIYFYTLIAMTCIFASNSGVLLMLELEADQSKTAARMNCAPIPKFIWFLVSVFGRLLVQVVQFMIVFFYCKELLRIDFGNRTVYILLLGVLGCLLGIFLGTSIGAVRRGRVKFKMAVATTGTILLCFFSGMMVVEMKYLVQDKIPLLASLSPVSRITDALYALYYYEDTKRYWDNMSVLVIMTVLFFVGTALAVRRRQYDHI